MNELNKYFDVSDEVGKSITENEFQCLLAAKRLWTTKCRMDRATAWRAMGGDPVRFSEDERTYGGLIVTDAPEDEAEARRAAMLRGFGESVEGVLCGVIPYNSNMINPCDTSNQSN